MMTDQNVPAQHAVVEFREWALRIAGMREQTQGASAEERISALAVDIEAALRQAWLIGHESDR